MPPIRVLVVDDAALFRRSVSEELSRDPAVEVVGTAPNGRIALARMTQVQPLQPSDPVVLQVSRWDALKDPAGVVAALRNL